MFHILRFGDLTSVALHGFESKFRKNHYFISALLVYEKCSSIFLTFL